MLPETPTTMRRPASGPRPSVMPCVRAVRGLGSLAVALRLPRVPDAAQREVGLDGVDAGDLAEPRLVGVAAGRDDRHAAAGGERSSSSPRSAVSRPLTRPM